MASVLSGATVSQLARWRSSLGPLEPLLEPSHRDPARVLYSFEDIVALRSFVSLRQDASLQKIRRAVQFLRDKHPETHLSSHKLRAAPGGRTIVWIADDGDYVDVVEQPGQPGLTVVMEQIFGEFKTDDGRIVPDLIAPADGLLIDRETRGGYPVLDGTRLPFDTVAQLSEDGLSDADIIEIFPSATPRGIHGASQFAGMIRQNQYLRA